MTSLPRLRRSGVSLAVAISTAVLISGCAPSESDDAAVSSNDSDSTSGLDLAISGAALVQRTPFVAADAISSESECASGSGIRLRWGNDDEENPNGELDEDEVAQTVYICHGIAGQDGLDGANGENGTDGQDGNDGEDGVSAHFVVSSTTETCLNGGQTITIGLNDGADNFVAGSTQSFEICNGADGSNGTNGTGSGSDTTADRIAQGKALVESAKGYINDLVSGDTYITYLNDMDDVFAGEEVEALYQTLGGLVNVSFDALYVNDVPNYTQFVSDALADAEGVDTSGMEVTESGGLLSITGLVVNNVTVNEFSFNYLEHEKIENDSVDRFEVTALDLVSGDATLSLASDSNVSFEVRLASGSSSLATIEEYKYLGTEEGDEAWATNVDFFVNDDSAATMSLKGVVLGLADSTEPGSFQGDIVLSLALTESSFAAGFPVLDFDSLSLAGAFTDEMGDTLDISFDVAFGPTFVPVDPIDPTEEDLEPIAQNLAAILKQGIPVTWGSYSTEWGQTLNTATVDYSFLLTALENTLDEGVEISGFYNDGEWFKKVIENSGSCDSAVNYYDQSGELLRTESQNYCYSNSIYDSSYLSFYDSVVVELSNGYHLDLDFSTSYDLDLSESDSVIPTSYANYGVVQSNKNASIDRLGFSVNSSVGRSQSFELEITDIGLSEEYYNPASYSRPTELEGTAKVSFDDDTLTATFPVWMDFYSDSYACSDYVPTRSEQSYQYYSGDFDWCLGGAAQVGADPDDIKIHFTDNDGAAFDITFQDRAYDERFNAYVTVDGVNVGQLVQLRDGSYAVEFRDYERVVLTDN